MERGVWRGLSRFGEGDPELVVAELVSVLYPTDACIIFISWEPLRPPATCEFPVFYGCYQTVGARGCMAAIADGDEVSL
jgi:hypothetical protein